MPPVATRRPSAPTRPAMKYCARLHQPLRRRDQHALLYRLDHRGDAPRGAGATGSAAGAAHPDAVRRQRATFFCWDSRARAPRCWRWHSTAIRAWPASRNTSCSRPACSDTCASRWISRRSCAPMRTNSARCAQRYWQEVRAAGIERHRQGVRRQASAALAQAAADRAIVPAGQDPVRAPRPAGRGAQLLPAALQHESGDVPDADTARGRGVLRCHHEPGRTGAAVARAGLARGALRGPGRGPGPASCARSASTSASSGSRTWGISPRAPRRASAPRPAPRNWRAGSTNQAWDTGGTTAPRMESVRPTLDPWAKQLGYAD